MSAPNRLASQGIESALLLEEAIWGHRLYDEQTPWLTLLEFFMILAAEEEAGRAFTEPKGPNTLEYKACRRLHLRNILFNNPWLDLVRHEHGTSEDQWRRWLEIMRKESAGIPMLHRDFSYLQKRIPNFADFCDLVQLFCGSAIEGESNKRWSSKFPFPFGPDCLFEDLRVTGEKASNDRRFFARTGELLYLMLCRSGRGADLCARLQGLVLNREAPWNRLAKLLQPPDYEDPRTPTSGAYLPYEKLPDYAELADDWVRLLDLKMPGYDVLPHLANVTGLHLLLYVLRRACDWAKSGRKGVTFVLEIVNPTPTMVRQASIEQYEHNLYLPREAIDGYLKVVWESPAVQSALRGQAPFHATKTALENALNINWGKMGEQASSEPKKLFEEVVRFAQKRHRQHFANIHREYGREIGLISRRGARRPRYAPSDAFLRSLVFANVAGHMELNEFLERLYLRYGFVVGDAQAKEALRASGADRKAFRQNAMRLEARLRALGLIRRLSDDCAYVLNSYSPDRGAER